MMLRLLVPVITGDFRIRFQEMAVRKDPREPGQSGSQTLIFSDSIVEVGGAISVESCNTFCGGLRLIIKSAVLRGQSITVFNMKITREAVFEIAASMPLRRLRQEFMML